MSDRQRKPAFQTIMRHPHEQTGEDIDFYLYSVANVTHDPIEASQERPEPQAEIKLASVKRDLMDSLEAVQKRYEFQVEIKLDKAEVYLILRTVKAYLKCDGRFQIGRWRLDREWQNKNRVEEITDLRLYYQPNEEPIRLYFDNYTWQIEKPEDAWKGEWVEGHRFVRHEELFIPQQPTLGWSGRNISTGFWRISRLAD